MVVGLQVYGMRRLAENLRNDTMADLEPDVLTIPASHFVDTGHAQRELALMRTLPLVVGHGSELPSPGSFVTREILGTPVILARRDDGTVAGYLNMCRHRGAIVETEPSGAHRLFTCGYHGWSYERDSGELRHVPFGDNFGDIDPGCKSLISITVQEHHGLLWTALEPRAPFDVQAYLGPEIESQLDDFGLRRATLFHQEDIHLDFNWKLVMDGAIDVLHLKFLHPQGVAKFLVTGRSCFDKYGRHGQNFTPRKRLERIVDDGVEPAADELWRYMSTNIVIYPNSMCIKAPDHFEFWTVMPHQ